MYQSTNQISIIACHVASSDMQCKPSKCMAHYFQSNIIKYLA